MELGLTRLDAVDVSLLCILSESLPRTLEAEVDEAEDCESLDFDGAVMVTVTVPKVDEAMFSVARREPIKSGIDVLIGYSIDSVPICCSDMTDKLLDCVVVVMVKVSIEEVDEPALVEVLMVLALKNGVGVALADTLESSDGEAELEYNDKAELGDDGQLTLVSVHDKLDEGRLLDKAVLEDMLCNVVDDSDSVVELLRSELLTPTNHVLKFDGVGMGVVDIVVGLGDDAACQSAVDVARSVTPEWLSVKDNDVEVESMFVDESAVGDT
ncbi:hypothetical protein GGI20_005666 [Coemansia sp. BCRC 34301]|nr:hypothetical protein GGI20_005666 [Coemansia sp. BCRC 34301]